MIRVLKTWGLLFEIEGFGHRPIVILGSIELGRCRILEILDQNGGSE